MFLFCFCMACIGWVVLLVWFEGCGFCICMVVVVDLLPLV